MQRSAANTEAKYLGDRVHPKLSYVLASLRSMSVAELLYGAGDSGSARPILSVVGDGVPDAELSVEELGSRIVGLSGRLASAMCRWLLLVAAFDAREGYARFGLWSTPRWVSHYCGLSRRTAIEHVRVARALAAYPVLVEAMSAGRISFSHARAISRLAEVGSPRLVAELVMVAEHGTVGQLEDVVRGLRSVDDNNRGRGDELDPDPEVVSHRWRSDSRFGFSAKLDPEHGALLHSALDTIAARENITRAQALTRIAEIALATVAAAGERPAPSLRGDEHAALVIHLHATAAPTEPELELNPPAPSPRAPNRSWPSPSASPPRRSRSSRSRRPVRRVRRGVQLNTPPPPPPPRTRTRTPGTWSGSGWRGWCGRWPRVPGAAGRSSGEPGSS